MSLKQEDYSECLFNPLESGRMMILHEKIRSLFEQYEPFAAEIEEQNKPKKKKKRRSPLQEEDEQPEIDIVEPFKVGSSALFDKIIRYIIMMYDKNTPLKMREPHYMKRKAKAASYAAFETEEEKLVDKFAQRMISGEIDWVNRMIVLYVRCFRSLLYYRIVGMEEAYANALASALEGGHDKKLTDQLRELGEEIENMYGDLLSSKNDVKLTDELLTVMEEERAGLRPEDYAQRVASGEYISA